MSIHVFCPFVKWIICFPDVELHKLLYFLDINPYQVFHLQISSPFNSFSFLLVLLILSFAVQKLSSLMWSQKFTFAFISLASGNIPRKMLLWPMSEKLLPVLSSRIFMVSGLTFRFFIHFEFIFVYGVRKWSSFILLHVVAQFSQHYLLKRLFPIAYSCLLCHRSIGRVMVGLFLGSLFSSIDLCVCFGSVPHCSAY
uniref:Uncharacterized protein n=1 Tax=Felis catus TaxID=9685 RepID=A0ABI7XB88_FELCA